MNDLVTLCCPECDDTVCDTPPTGWILPGPEPGYSHLSDGTALCPVITTCGYRPADPIEHQTRH